MIIPYLGGLGEGKREQREPGSKEWKRKGREAGEVTSGKWEKKNGGKQYETYWNGRDFQTLPPCLPLKVHRRNKGVVSIISGDGLLLS